MVYFSGILHQCLTLNLSCTVYCKSFEMEKFCRSIIKYENFIAKHFCFDKSFKNGGLQSRVFFKPCRKHSCELYSVLGKSLEYFRPSRIMEYMAPTDLIKLISNTMLKWHVAHYFVFGYNVVISSVYQFSSAFQQFPNDGQPMILINMIPMYAAVQSANPFIKVSALPD